MKIKLGTAALAFGVASGWRNKWRCTAEMAEDEDVFTGAEVIRRRGDEWLSPTLHPTKEAAEAVARDCIESDQREGCPSPNEYLGAVFEHDPKQEVDGK